MLDSPVTTAEMTQERAQEISGWRYGEGFEIYDMPGWEEMLRDGWALANPEKRKTEYMAFLNADGELAAFTRHTEQDGGIMLGVGANPAFLSRGYGSAAIRLTVERLKAEHPGSEIFLDVRTWNTRAVRSYEKAGFKVTDTIVQETHAGKGEFYRMYYMEKP